MVGLGDVIWTVGSAYSFALFPIRGVIALQVVTDSGKHVEVGLVGPEGYADVPFFLGGERTQVVATALTKGEMALMDCNDFNGSMKNARFRAAIEHYSRTFLSMACHIAVCNRIHSIEKTLVGRLLLLQDRTNMDTT